ncbi:MAG: hypothetical protein Q7S04_02000 [Candidatus Moranbacteria bacterium]|nr:hypothetical protein [Candidatus Moranbacteria bacterium]
MSHSKVVPKYCFFFLRLATVTFVTNESVTVERDGCLPAGRQGLDRTAPCSTE